MEEDSRALRLLRVVNTARHLEPAQVAAWVRRRLAGPDTRLPEPKASARRSAAWEALAQATRELDEPAVGTRGDRADALVGRRFEFVGTERHLPDIDWSAEYVSPLWTYHLHYLDDAVVLARAWRRSKEEHYGEALVDLWTSWLDAAEAGAAPLEPYPASVRCLNALHSLWLVEDLLPRPFADRLLGTTHAQLVWLSDHIERHLRANHLQKNLVALAWGSLAFGDESAQEWGRLRAELWAELDEQVLPDGGHYERSPMYHAGALDDWLRTLALCRAARERVPGGVPGRLAAMTRALQWLSRPDGTLHLFNDAANGQGPRRGEVLALARRVLGAEFPEPSGTFALDTTGYFGYAGTGRGPRLVVDAGRLGPDHQPGHAHCDMLSFELDLAGRPIVVDAGVHGYDGDPYREYVRSTRAHNTVSIDGREQHEMWATFRVARRGEIVEAHSDESSGEGIYTFRGACRSYHDRDAVHHRLIELAEDRLVVTDRVARAAGRPVTSWLHLHPDLKLESGAEGASDDGHSFIAVADDSRVRVRIEARGADEVQIRRAECDPVQGWHCPQFGVAIPAPVLELRIRSNDGRAFGWSLHQT